MSADGPPSFDLVRCRVEGCEWSQLTTTGAYRAAEKHLKHEHGFTDEEWRQTRAEMMEEYQR